jgi:L-arabinose isomerase
MPNLSTIDAHGNTVDVGTLVRVLAIDASAFTELDETNRERVQSMLNQKLAVYEVDPYGRAWVEQWWHEGSAHATSHSLALDPHQMEVC